MGKRINRYRIKVEYSDGGKLSLNARVAVWKDETFKSDLERVGFILDANRIGWDGFMTLGGKRLEENKVITAINEGIATLAECKKIY